MNANTTPTINNDNLTPGYIWSPVLERDLEGVRVRQLPDLLVLSYPQELPNGQLAVTVVPIHYGWELLQMVETDLLLFWPFVPEEHEAVCLQFHALQSVLVSDLHRERWAVKEKVFPLLRAFWKSVEGLGSRPQPEEFEPSLAWDSGWPIPLARDGSGLPNPADVRLERLNAVSERLGWLASRFQTALHAGEE